MGLENIWKETNIGNITAELACTELEVLLDKYEWFYCSQVEDRNLIVYCNEINGETGKIVPEILYGFSVKLRFTEYLLCGEKYGKDRPKINFSK